MNATGTVTDGVAGLSAMRLHTHNASALKAVAFMPQGLVHFVAAAGCAKDTDCGAVVTTLENNVAHGPVHLSCGGGALVSVPRGTLRKPFVGCDWAWHNMTGYLLPATPAVLVTNGIDRDVANAALPLFSLAIEHTGPRTASVWWSTVPGVSLSDMAGVAASFNNVSVVANHDGMQAAWNARRQQLLAVLWREDAQSLNLTAGLLAGGSLQADRPALLSIRQSSQCGSFTVTAADPSNNPKGGVLTVRITSAGAGATICNVPPCACSSEGEVTSVRLQLPAGFDAGKSVDVTCVPHVCTTIPPAETTSAPHALLTNHRPSRSIG